MVYVKIKDGQVEEKGTLYKLLPKISNPIGLNDEELKGMNVYKPIPDARQLKNWESLKAVNYIYNSTDNVVNEVKMIDISDLETFKEKKYKQIKGEISSFILAKCPYYKQLSALAGIYDETTNTEITEYCRKYVHMALDIKNTITNATSYDEVDNVFFRKVEHDEDTMEIISETFWGD